MYRRQVHAPWLQSLYFALLPVAAFITAGVVGCSKDSPPAPGSTTASGAALGAASASDAGPALESSGSEPPAGLVPVSFSGQTITIWPYTGTSFNGVPSDPINLIFTGHADPLQIRAALLSLDGDRSAFGMPPVPPFNSTWSEAIGDVQTSYAEGAGWIGSVVQLQLGSYDPIRFHLRLFRTGRPFGTDGEWTLGAAHFEVLIPGTTEHQVLSWEFAQQLVMVDLIRSGLIPPGVPPLSGPINQAPSFREIPDFIYNLLPPELIGALAPFGAPPQPVSAPVPLASDGQATILDLVTAPAVAIGSASQSYTLEFGQAIPKPLCSDGPYDWVYVTGPVEFGETAGVDEAGRYEYHTRISGRLTVTPVDITTSPPTPVGAPFSAMVSDVQSGFLDGGSESVQAQTKRIAPQKGGSELLMSSLKVAAPGPDRHRFATQCLQP